MTTHHTLCFTPLAAARPRTLAAVAVLLAGALAALPPAARAADADWGIKIRGGGVTEEARDLGMNGGADYEESFIEVMPQLHTQFSPDFAHFVRVQGFLPSGMVVMSENDEPVEVQSYAALREFWVEFGGITDYPGEVLRLGLQRLRDYDGLWWDRDVEAARWIFDTTLFQFQLGAAKQFDTYRTDDVQLPDGQEDRAYGFMGISTQWVPRNFVGARAAYATDQKELPPSGTALEPTGPAADDGNPLTPPQTTYDEPEVRDYGWVGVFLDNRFFEYERGPGLTYRVEVMGLRGEIEEATVNCANEGDPACGRVAGSRTEDVDAVGGDAGVRLRFADAFPLTVGGAYAYGEGGGDANGTHDFRQTGLQSNRSRFTGTRTMMHRFNEALQADLTNLKVVSAFVALPLIDWDFSLVGHRFERDDPSRRVYTDGLDVQPSRINGSTDLGTGYDVVLTRHFDRQRAAYSAEDDTRSNIRLRGSRFEPGAAYGTSLKDQVKIMLEATLWF